MKCPHCNQEHPDNYQYCPITGGKIELLKVCSNPLCPEFGRIIIPERFRFCPYCGHEFVISSDFEINRLEEDSDSFINDDNSELLSCHNYETENINEEKRYVVTLVSFENNNKWQTIKAIQGVRGCSLLEAQSYIDNLPLEIMCIAREVNFIKKTFEELGATVQLHEYTEDDEDETITCPNCESENIVDEGSGYLQFICQDCGYNWGDRNDIACPICGSYDVWDDGNKFENQLTCNHCGHEWDEDDVEEKLDDETNIKPYVNIHKIWIDTAYERGDKGIKIHLNVDMHGLKNKSIDVIANFYYATNTPIKDTNGKYRALDGNVAASINTYPPYAKCNYNDLTMFIPLKELHINRECACYFIIRIWYNGLPLFTSSKVDFYVDHPQ